MIDGVKIFVPNGKIWGENGVPLTNEIKNSVYFDHSTDVNTAIGYYKNLQLTQRITGLFIEGSLNWFLHGNNMEPFTLSDCEQALKTLENTLNIDLHKSELYRAEFGDTIIVDRPIPEYLECLGRYRNYRENLYFTSGEVIEDEKGIIPSAERDGCLTTKTYYTETGGLAFCVYDKIAQMKRKLKKAPKEIRAFSEIPQDFIGKNVIKLEYRLTKKAGVTNVFGRTLSPYDMLDENFSLKLEKRYLSFYKSINKINGIIFNNGEGLMTPKQVINLWVAKYLALYPYDCERELAIMKQQGRISKVSLKRIRQKERELAIKFVESNKLIKELNDKINSKKRVYA